MAVYGKSLLMSICFKLKDIRHKPQTHQLLKKEQCIEFKDIFYRFFGQIDPQPFSGYSHILFHQVELVLVLSMKYVGSIQFKQITYNDNKVKKPSSTWARGHNERRKSRFLVQRIEFNVRLTRACVHECSRQRLGICMMRRNSTNPKYMCGKRIL